MMSEKTAPGIILDKAACSGVMVFAESYQGRFEPVTYELIGKARELADKTGQDVVCVAIGHWPREADGCFGGRSQQSEDRRPDGHHVAADLLRCPADLLRCPADPLRCPADPLRCPADLLRCPADILRCSADLLRYPVDRVLVYNAPEFAHFVAGVYAAAMEEAILIEKPSVVLIGATPVGRSLAPRVAVRFRTGLTADCTVLDIRPNGELVQTRPAFGGNIMATIVTRNARPQMATVRPKVMPRAEALLDQEAVRQSNGRSRLRSEKITSDHALAELARHLQMVRVTAEKPLPQADSISDAKIIVACGRGVRSQDDLKIFDELAQKIGGVLAGSRPLVEQGWMAADRQVGQSGRTVRPDVYIACGISGAIQHIAGMSGSTTIIAINQDKDAPIFETANYGLVGDMYEIVPALLRLLETDDAKVSPDGGV